MLASKRFTKQLSVEQQSVNYFITCHLGRETCPITIRLNNMDGAHFDLRLDPGNAQEMADELQLRVAQYLATRRVK